MEQKPKIVKSHDVWLDGDYADWMAELKIRYRSAQFKAVVRVNVEKLQFYWQLGRDLVQKRAEERWGSGVVEQVALDLQAEFPTEKGFSVTNLRYMKQWYLFYSSDEANKKLPQLVGEIQTTRSQFVAILPKNATNAENLPQVVGEIPSPFALIPWGHHREIISHCNDIDEALFYIRYTIQNALSREMLVRVMKKDDLYHHQAPAINNFASLLTPGQTLLAQEIVKENYDFSFATVEHPLYSEQELEEALHQNITDFLLELGTGFAFLGRQREIRYGNNSRKVDLLFYHIHLRCYVVVELKARAFEPEFAGKLNLYVNMVDDALRSEGDNPTIGLLICDSMDRADVQWSFRGIQTPMSVATYNNIRIKDALPTQEQLRERMALLKRQLSATKRLLEKQK